MQSKDKKEKTWEEILDEKKKLKKEYADKNEIAFNENLVYSRKNPPSKENAPGFKKLLEKHKKELDEVERKQDENLK